MRSTFDTARTAAGYSFRLRSDIPSAPFVLGRLFAAFREIQPNPRIPTYTLARNGRNGRRFALRLDRDTIQRVDNAGSMLDWLIGDITRKSVEQLQGYLAIHAGVVAVDGHAVILPARPDSGKTTTVAGLTRAGFSYLTEEVALLDIRTGIVDPFPRPLMMESSSVDVLGDLRAELPEPYEEFRRQLYHVAPDDLRARSIGGPSVVSFVVVPCYARGAVTKLVPMTKAETLVALAKNSFNFRVLGSVGLSLLEGVARRAPGYRLEIGDLPSAVRLIEELVRDGGASFPASARSGG
jgi:hypothetical protein